MTEKQPLPPMREMAGTRIAGLMRRNHVTIKILSKRMGITMKRIRHVRTEGLTNFVTYLDWYEHITGGLSPRLQAAWKQYRRQFLGHDR